MTTTDPYLERARDFTLAALTSGYPSDEAHETLRQLRHQVGSHRGLAPWLTAADLDLQALRSDYAACFDTGPGRASLHETEYGRMRGLSKGRDLADLMGFYTAFGFQLSDEVAAELPDHVAVELEFYALLLYKQSLLREDTEGTEVVARARRSFLQEHLGSFVRAAALRPVVLAHPVFGPLVHWCASLVEAECALEGVTPAPLDFFEGKAEDEEVSCGACVTPPG